jgi:hypothetical protein
MCYILFMTIGPLNGGFISQFILDIRPLFLAVFRHIVFANGFLIMVKELRLLTNPSQWIMGLDVAVNYLGWLSFMSTLEEISVANSGSTKVWVMDPSLFDV